MNIDKLRDAVMAAPAIRAITRLQPAGGPGDKVFPPTYAQDDKSATTKYATEMRRVGDREAQCVLLDSVASQANRMEEALLEGWKRKELDFPVVWVDFRNEAGLEDLDTISSLDAPHRIADALLRDSLLDGTLFRLTPLGQAVTDASPKHATGMYLHCPTALVFGVWDSTGPKGGLGAKFQRCLVSEIVAIDAVPGVKVGGRIDPAAIERKSGEVYKAKDPAEEWTTDPSLALQEKGKPVLFSRKGAEGKGTPATINHGNIPPQIDTLAGGITMDHAVQTTVLSLAGLRRLRFVTDMRGTLIPEARRADAELAARTALAALALAAIVYQRDEGHDLRSRSLLVATEPLKLELLARDGSKPAELTLDRAGAASLLREAAAAAEAHGLAWSRGPVTLQPAPKLASLVRSSRQLRVQGEAEES